MTISELTDFSNALCVCLIWNMQTSGLQNWLKYSNVSHDTQCVSWYSMCIIWHYTVLFFSLTPWSLGNSMMNYYYRECTEFASYMLLSVKSTNYCYLPHRWFDIIDHRSNLSQSNKNDLCYKLSCRPGSTALKGL